MAEIVHPRPASAMTSTCSSCESIGWDSCCDVGCEHQQHRESCLLRAGAGPAASSGGEHFQRAGLSTFTRAPPSARIRDSRTGRWRYPWVFRMTLSCSKHGYEEALTDQKALSFMRAHEHAFLEFGGVPRVVRMDNTKTAVTRACLYDPDLNEVYEAFAKHWAFIPLPSRPHHPQEQGVQE